MTLTNFEKRARRLLGKARTSPEATPKLLLRDWSRGRRSGDRSPTIPAVPVADPRREAAEIQSVAARLVLTRHRVERMRTELAERDKSQSEVTTATVELIAQLADAGLDAQILEAIRRGLGDMESEALEVTR